MMLSARSAVLLKGTAQRSPFEGSRPPPINPSVEAEMPHLAPTTRQALAIPLYLRQLYWWAYVHPKAVQIFEREWLVDLILDRKSVV